MPNTNPLKQIVINSKLYLSILKLSYKFMKTCCLIALDMLSR